jgi:hypothetical protein
MALRRGDISTYIYAKRTSLKNKSLYIKSPHKTIVIKFFENLDGQKQCFSPKLIGLYILASP